MSLHPGNTHFGHKPDWVMPEQALTAARGRPYKDWLASAKLGAGSSGG
jgi:hypothetical protein